MSQGTNVLEPKSFRFLNDQVNLKCPYFLTTTKIKKRMLAGVLVWYVWDQYDLLGVWGQLPLAVVLNCRKLASTDFHPSQYITSLAINLFPDISTHPPPKSPSLYCAPPLMQTNHTLLTINAEMSSSSSSNPHFYRHSQSLWAGEGSFYSRDPLARNVSILWTTTHDISISH